MIPAAQAALCHSFLTKLMIPIRTVATALTLGTTLSLLACAAAPLAVAPCREHCVTHEDGYQWAQNGNLGDPSACTGYSEAFERGCRNGVEDLSQLHPKQQGL
jgi:hypothetical protein